MTHMRILAFAALGTAFLMSLPTFAGAQSSTGLAETYRGMYVCQKLPMGRDILRAPADLVIRGSDVQFARPLFNLDGTRVVGSEMASGSIDGDGKLHLTSAWSFMGNTAQGDYSGTLTSTGGTLTGTQTWRGPDTTGQLSRTCTVALVPAPIAARQTSQQ
jgi:hypothetical protein